MRILLVADARTEARLVAAYVAERFASAAVDTAIEVDVLTVVGRGADRRRHDVDVGAARETATAANEVAERLRELVAITRIDTHVEQADDAVTAIAAAATHLHSDVVLLETAPHGLVARLRSAGLTRGLLRAAPCAVELIKPFAAAPRSLFNVLVPIAGDRLADFPLHRLAALPWPVATRLRLLATLPAAGLELPSETNVLRVFDSVARSHAAASRTGAVLGEMADELALVFDGAVEVDHAILDTGGNHAVLGEAERYRASLIVTCTAAVSPALDAVASSRDPALRLATAARCAVLVLREDVQPARRARARARTFSPALVRA
ncbi:MAG: hypothetical protein AB7Q81_22800 [Gammaproteobacteria bacterium]